MTSRRLVAALAAATALLMAAPSLAGAARLRRRPTTGVPSSCRLTLLAEPRRITAGDETPQLFGRLICGRAVETAGQPVTIYERAPGRLAKTVLGTTTTTTGGYYSFVAPAPTSNTIYYAAVGTVTSLGRAVRVAPQVTLSGPSESKALYTGFHNRVAFSGTVSPADAGALVRLQRESSTAYEEWFTIQFGVVLPGGVYSLVHTFVEPGDANIRVLVRAHGIYTVAGASSPISYVISQAQNPLLTLFATIGGAQHNQISYGQSVALEGTVAGGAGKQVTLAAHTRGGIGWVTVASQTASSSGHYGFTQTPAESTAYKVLSATGSHSRILFEGVRYVLTAAPSTSTLQDGQVLTVTGTVTPYLAGHMVYLERESSAGSGPFHAVAVAPLSASTIAGGPATYTISRTMFGVGKQTYRIKVPGDPANQGIASAPFTVEVTPAPPSVLGPGLQPPLPNEGNA